MKKRKQLNKALKTFRKLSKGYKSVPIESITNVGMVNSPKVSPSRNVGEMDILGDVIVDIYSTYLKVKVEKAKNIISLAQANKDSDVIKSIFRFNEKLAKILNIVFESLTFEQQMTLFIDNAQYLEKLRKYLSNPRINENYEIEDDLFEDEDEDEIDNDIDIIPADKAQEAFVEYINQLIEDSCYLVSLKVESAKKIKDIVSKYL